MIDFATMNTYQLPFAIARAIQAKAELLYEIDLGETTFECKDPAIMTYKSDMIERLDTYIADMCNEILTRRSYENNCASLLKRLADLMEKDLL